MKKKFVRLISAVLSAAMTLTAVPLSAFAEGEGHTHDGESNVITTPLDFREKTADENGVGWSWDHDTKTLTLDGVNIQATTEENMMSVVTVPDGTEIVLNGENTIVQTDTGKSDTYVLSAVNNKEVNCDGTMTISGDGVLNAENRSTDSMARSLGGSIILNGGTVNATGKVVAESLEIHNDGALNAEASAVSNDGAAVGVKRGITVDGNGSLTAVGCANESTLNSAILLTSNFDKISVSENGSITVPEGNAARVGIYYDGNKSIDAEISGGKVTAYGTKCGIYKVNLIMSGTGSVYATGGTYGIGQTVPTIDEDEFVVKGSTEFKAEESAVTADAKYNSGYYEIDGADAKTVVIKPDTSPRIILGKQTGIFKTEEYKIIEDIDMTDIKLKGTVYFDITLKNMSDEEFADARGCFGGDEPDLLASIIKTDYGWVCMVCDTKFSTTYDTDNTLTIKCGDIVSNTVQVKSNANRFNKVTQGDNTNRTVFYTNTSQEEKDNYKLVSTYTVDSESISYNWYSTNSAYSADELGAAVSGSNGEFKLADNIPAGNYVLYCDITYSDGDSTETVTEKFTFTYKECAHENGYSDGKCTNCGALCDHSDIDINTGKCNECAHQFVATISTDGNAPTGYDTLADCLDSITAETGNYVKIYQDIGDAAATTDTVINVNHNVMIDLNGHKLNNIKLEVNKDVTLTLTGTEGSYVDQVYVRKGGGSFIIDSEANVEFDTIFAEAGTRFTVSDGANVTVRYLAVKESLSNEGNATSVKLATGMKITEMLAYDLDNSSPLSENIMLKNLLSDNQMLKYESSSKIINLYYGATRIIINSKTYGYGTITVVEHTDADHKYSDGTGKCEECGKPCEHGGDINTDTGICSICGAVVSVALYTDKNGSLKYVDTDELHSLLNESGKSGTVKLFKDYYKLEQHDIDGVITIDLNGHDFTVRGVTPWSGGKVTFKNSGSEQVTCSGSVSPTVDDPGGTLIVDGDIYFDSAININDYGTVILNAGKYVDLTIKGDRTLCDMLGEGKAFFDADGNLFNASVQAGSDLTVKDHSHTYTDGKCDCGYVCTHSNIDIDTGKCTECEYQYAAVIVKDGAAASVYKETEMEAAFEAADSDANTDCTLRVYKNYTGIYTTLSGKFTLWIAEKANVGTLTVSGDITVTGSGKNNSIYGDFNVANDGKLTFDENCGAMGTVSVGAGTFDCYYSIDITLNINDASSDVILHGGAFRKICYNGGGDRANAEILTLLAENRMFMWRSGGPIDGSKTLLKDGFATTVFVIPHEGHSYDSTTGKCKLCGKRCGHTDVDSKTGVCPTCKYQLTAIISGVETPSYFGNIDDAFAAATSEENSGCTLTLYKDCELSQNIVIGNATLTVDVNGHFISPEIRGIDVNDGGVLYLKNSGENGSIGLEMAVNKGGTLINGTADDSSSAVSLFAVTADAAECVEFYGGSCTYLTIKNGTSGIALYGGYYDIICGPLTDNTPVNDLLAKGYAFATLNSVTHLPESIVDGSAKTIGDGLTNVMVVAHEHRYNVETGKCPCGVCALAIFTETTQSSETYTFIESETQFKNIAENEADGVLKLTGDVDCIVKGIIINGNKTIDMNGHTLNVSVGTEEISAVAVYGNVTFENSGSSRAVINATGVYSYGMVTVNGDIEFDTFATFEDGDALINAGVFKSIYVQGRSVIEILGSGKALASESGEILNASVQQIYKAGDNIFVKAHPKHTYDDHGNCACGYKCLHDGEGQVNEDSANKVCSECGAKIYAKVTTADGKVKYFDDITEGLRYADKAENKGCVFTLVTTGGLENDITLSSGQFTITAIDDNYINAYTRKINIKGAEITVENCAFNCFVGLYSGSLTYPEGSTSVCINGISVFGGTLNISDGVSENFGANKFTISDTATDAKVTIGGGIYSEIKLGQYTFKDILASGTRLISVEYSQETDEIIATNELLYSIVSEQNTLGVDDDKDYRFVKCDHKNEDGSYAFNEGGICKYCGSEFAASVSYTTADNSEKTELFSDICDAFDKANGVGTATVTLYKDITDSERTQEITVMGNVTLELNGKTLGGRYGIARISVSDGGTLTVNGDGDMDTPIYVNENSKLVINGGGYFNSVSVKKGGNAEIGGGTIRGLSVRGNVKLSGGKFNDIEIFNGNLESVLADGYAYKVEDGTWLSIAERAESVYSSLNNNDKPLSVEEAPIKSASIAWVGEEAPVIYRNGEKYLYVDITYELAVGSRGATYSDFVNGNNRIKDYNLYNKYMVHCYEIGKLAAKDGEVEYYIVLKCNGYEYKSNVLKLTLATCSHPKDSFSYENDGFVICGICDALIEAEVVDADGKSLGYADIESAIKLAQENEGSTVKLMSEGVSESVTVTGGRFTVDFNGKKVFYQFDVNGGDVTFTSSVKQADVETLISGIEVNGTDAKVTIDGKIKLGSVTLTSGALAVNSAESYIKELSIIGGNAVIDNAIIGALQTNGGDTVIKNVNAGSLSVNAGTTDGSEYNVSIVSGMFGSFTCENGSNYTLGRAIASGSVVSADSMNGITVYTYEAIQTMTSTYRIFVDKCVHKGEKGSYVLDGNPCPYCNKEIVATVSYTAGGSEETDLFSDIYDAFERANEIGTATITLCRDIADSEIAHEINVTGNVTLALNGKTLGATDKAKKIYICGSTLTVNGNGKVWSAIEAKPDSKLTITNGEYYDVYALSDSEVVILDGIIDCLSVYGTGKAEVSGGKFKYLYMYNGKAIESVLADGYAYKNADGTWLSIDKREKDSYLGGSDGALSVEEAPIKSASIAWYGGGTPVVYRNGAKNLDVNITYELADASKQITYSDYVNGNNHSKDSEFSDNWYTVFGYEIGDIITEDGEVEYYTVLKCDGYEYKSNVLKLTLATCSHPEDSFTEKNNDGGVFCGICDLLIGAQVIKADGEPLGYADIESAIKLAQENEGSTVKLISERVPASITVTGGKFTVDFNGKEVYYNSDVKGGDVTFTSSVKQADAENLLSTINVNGADAKVTIDGKIKLGRVRTLSGTLTVNSTDGYIGELSIEGAKTDVDGARIGALRTFGGEAVIKNVTADSLAMFDNRSGGSEYNVSIVSGMFGSFTCENGSNYTLGRAIASGSVVSADSMNGITVYTYEAIQTMTSTYRIFVDKCNHKDKNGSYVLDGNPCPYCNEEIVATVSYTANGSEETDLFSDIYDAFAKANEIGTATVTLQKNITDDITDTIAVTGNVTLELNGKKLSTPGFDPYYTIEVKSGKLTVNGSGTIKCAVVRNGGDAEINGGIFSDFRIEDGGNAVINGGKFNSIKVSGEGRNVGQLLADGYAYKNFDGFWSTVAEREKRDIASVNVLEAPIKSATITAEDESPIIYRNGNNSVDYTANVTYSGNETLYVTGCLIDGTVIKEKTELLNGRCRLGSREVADVVAEDGEIQYYCIFTYDGYDYKSNVVTLTVATCQHPVESVKCDDNGCVCGICNRALPASVELSDGTLSYYENWNDAIGAAEESEGCTLKLLDYSGVNDGEIFDISKGRFTVDLNKNDGNTAFAFDVKGGDITFTASQEASSSLTGVTVSGENANVLIDSKATLNYLVVNSGKVSADGANIGAITINGGDTVINDVNADYLSMKADTTGGSGYNVSIVSGTFNIFTCENESNYTLGRAIASGSRVIGLNAIVGSGFKYAEIQSMTKANYLNVIKCDHKDENDSYALDGNLCPYCNEEIVATVSYTTANGGEQTDLFSDIYDAFERANEVGTATVTLYKDIENSELTRYITVTGNVTLALNGKKLGYSFVSLTIVVSNGGMLTVDGDGKMMVPIIVNENAKLAVNGGEIATVMIYKDGDAVIGGGFIEDLVVNGNAKLSGGKFYNIEIANGSLESILADGYAYKKNGGAWLSIAERAESVYSSVNNDNKPVNVEEAPIKSATLSTEINKLYRNSNANPTLKFNLALAHGSNLNDSYVSKRYGINSYVSGDIIYSSLSALVKDAKLSADEIIDKAGDSDVAKIYYVVTTGDGYEIKSNTVSIDLVDCDHSQVVDPTADKETAGNITTPTYCEICESKFNAKITKGDDVKYYNDLDEAAKDAQKSENEGCTLYPLYNKNGYGGQLVITEGNFTLKYAVRTAFSRPIIINGKAKLTVTGRCAVTAFENQDAFIVRGGDVTFDGLATGSNVTINGGNVTMASNNINCLTINGGNVSISSGGFAEIVTTVSDKVIADYIDPDFWVQDRETKEWIDIYSLNKATASSTNGLTVRVCPMQIIQPIDTVYYTNGYYPDGIPSLQISAVPWYSGEVDAKVAYQWIAIDENGNETVIEGATGETLSLENLTTGRYYCSLTYSNATTAGVSMASDVVTATITECEHSGGEATCTEKAKCEICGADYGEMLPHSYAHIKAPEYLKSAATCTTKAVYYTSCTECGQSSKGTKNEATFEYGNALGHKYGEWVSNGDGTHTRVCANDNKHTETKACHGGKATCTAKAICEVCGKAYGEMTAHTFTKTVSEKYLKSAATCTAKAVYYTSCADCGLSSKGTKNEATFEYGNALGHKYGEWVSNGNGTHTRVCANDSTHTETKACHGGKATCTAKAICEDCGKAYGTMTAHTFTAKSTISRYLKRAATCTEKSEYYVSCAGCGLSSKGTANEAVFTGSALGHSLTEWSVITEVTCTTNGTQERHCTRCDYKQTRTIVAKGHSYGLWNVTKKVGCITDGEQSRECSVCGNKETKTIAATGVHSYGSWKVAKAATCTTTGTKVRSCSECGAKETVILQPTGHKYVESTVKPTYTEKGYTLHKCSECGTSYKSSYTDKLVLASVSGVKLAGRAADALRVSWNRNTSADGYIVEIYKDGAWARAGKITTDSTTDFRVTGLKASTFYKFRVKAYKMSGNTAVYSDYGTTLTARTNPSVIKGAKLAGRAADALRISWDRNTSADGYIVEIYKDGAWSRAVKTTNNSITTYRAEGLKASTVYKLRVRAYKMDGTAAYYGNYSAEVTARTNPSVIKGAKLAGRADDALRISWERNTSADGYIVEVYKDGAWARAGKITTDSTTDFRVTGLKASTFYKFRVKAYKMSGNTAVYSDYGTTLTARTNPSVIKGAKLAGRAADALRISWDRNTSADGYIVEIYKDGAWSRAVKTTNNSITTYRAEGLKASTVYKLRVRAYKMDGTAAYYGNYSAEVTARTNPSVMTGVKIGGTAKDALRINWSKNTSAQGYIVEMAQNGEWVRVAKITDNSTTTFRKAGLAKNTSYRFRVCAYHMSGSTPLYGTYVSVSGKTAAN